MVKINGKVVPLAHTVCASSAFLASLLAGCILHYDKIVRNSFFEYPDEWFPSVSATIGSFYPERSIFQALIALAAIPRFLLILGHYYLSGSITTLIIGLVRTLSCGGWVYITSTDDQDVHDLFMILYIALTLPWNVYVTKSSEKSKKWRKLISIGFFGTMVPLVQHFVKHKVHMVPGAYSIYALLGWSLVALDIAFDAFSIKDFTSIEINLGLEPLQQGTWLFKREETSSKPVNGVKDEKLVSNGKESKLATNSERDAPGLYPSTLPQVESYTYILTNTYNSFIFWTAVTSITCSIWYFPLWNMGLSGYEAVMVYDLLPILLYIPYVPQIIHQHAVLLGGLLVVGSHFVGLPESRLLVTGAGDALVVSAFVLNLKSIKRPEVNAAFTVTWLLGLVISVILKFACHGNNPLWPITKAENGGYHNIGLIFTTIFGILAPYVNSLHFAPKDSSKADGKTTESIKSNKYKFFVGLGFGSIIFSLHRFFTDASALIYWSWEGWNQETQGPLAWPWSGLTCLVMLLASLTSVRFSKNTWVPGILLLESTWVLCNRNITEWDNYLYGGLPYILGVIWTIPSYFAALSELQSVGVIILGFVTYAFISFATVWTVAYAFVPLGWLLRERIEVVIWFSTALIVIGLFVIKVPADTVNSISSKPLGNAFFKRILILTSVIAAMIGGFTFENRPTGVPQPYHPESQMITAGIWTVHFGFDNNMWASEESMAFLLKSMELDVVGLLETDTQQIPMGNRDITSKLAHDLNMYADYGPGPNKHTWGCVLLSKFPIVNSTHHLLPSPVGELAPAIHATLKTYNDTLVDVFVFHGGQEEDELDRKLQSEVMAKLMGSTQRPTILLSYLVTDPHEGNYNTYVSETSGMRDIDPSDYERWCEYILYKDLKKLGYARVSRGTVTDTELQVGKFQVIPETQVKKLGEKLYDTVTLDTAEEDAHLFPEEFFDEGERGHYYHVFNRPRYFSLN
ncbi:hypothetical protein ZYGR_0P01520 [Zygosaccharomyces rouxii]|uniref:ZYRO0E03872p n=2 Tax=Zygosaccharomyces rouxii TaxID=4956 RepID=C5E489_ZYGRC|nr:uncharacterized protein ZYRO0E03872g [Zygosaccharomyces rouxii]KAH9198293.1 protein CWH43 [Zygosaccharomyces rouxii]GAV49508.1 hypothetical protein ZYGR_0P01520 [Zygosaccharomyces rouxii]CAQ43468.1 Protein CWH43 [Zygosaccharomyces rouxii]CAR30850.1 ZYRO0E03872p [Zygosaccharomyces rouxii]